MKIKVRPEDFIVREESAISLSDKPGRFAVLRLSKSQWDTFDLVDLLARRLGVPKADISYGGIKDRFGQTEQLISIRNPRPERPLVWAERGGDTGFSLRLAGYSHEPITARSIRGNRFTITLRDIDQKLVNRCRERAEAIARWGVPNYYDEQRFGSARHGKGFMGKEIFLGRRKQALRLYFEPSRYDDRKTRALKTCVIQSWSRWGECLPLAFGEYRRVIEYLGEHPGAYRQALLRIDRRFLVFVLNAYQSYLFNELLTATLRDLAVAHGLAMSHYTWRWGILLFYQALPESLFAALSSAVLPVPGYDSAPRDEGTRRNLEEVLDREGIGLQDLRVRQLPRISVHGIERPLLLLPEELVLGEAEEDELYPGKCRLTLRFGLPRGGYATLVTKALSAAGGLPQRLLDGS